MVTRRGRVASVVAAVVASGLALLIAGCRASVPVAREADARAVHDARDRYNAAIARRDAAAIGAMLLPSYHLVTGRSVQSHGREGEIAKWRTLFVDDTSVAYVRTPDRIQVNAGWGLAEEHGTWVGRLTAPDGPVRVSGVYGAKWQRATDGRWLLQAEVFTTLACAGGPQGCRPPDPVPE